MLSRVNVERARPEKVEPGVWKLDRMRAVLEELGNPHEQFKSLHVAGSKGKGSVVEMAAAALAGCGYVTGIYTSPHLIDIRERVRINEAKIAPRDFADLEAEVSAAAAKVATRGGESGGDATFFEIMTAMAFLHFARQAVDVAVIEVGLGGRLDSTNVITPLVCGVTAIQLEHTQILGDTHAKIASEKAGIFKPGVPAITIPQRDDVTEVFVKRAAEVGCPLSVVGLERVIDGAAGIEFSSRFEHGRENGHHCRVCVTSKFAHSGGSFEHIVVPLKGEHQAVNCGLALAMLDHLRPHGFKTPEREVAAGLAKTPTAGRLEVIHNAPTIVVDGAHTPDSVDALIKTLGSHRRFDSMVVVFGCASDKDMAGMVRAIAAGADKMLFTKATGNPRAAEPRELARKYVELAGRPGAVVPSVAEAMKRALQAAGREDLILVTGSYYIAGEAKAWVQGNL